MRKLLATLAIIGFCAAPAMGSAQANGIRPAHRVSTGGSHLTAVQKRWFGRAMDHMLRGGR